MTDLAFDLPESGVPGQYGVYVLFDAQGGVLYIGRTKNLPLRIRQHQDREWFGLIDHVEFTPCDGIHETRALEKSMIGTFRPESNSVDYKAPRKGRHLLPDWTVELLVGMYEAERAAGTRRVDTEAERNALNGYIAALREAGWSLASIGCALGMGREGVRLRETAATGVNRTLDVPVLPRKPPKVKRVRPSVPADVLAEMVALREVAQHVNGTTALDAPSRAASLRLTELIAEQVTSGVSMYRVAQQLGVTQRAVRSRLVRHGYATSKGASPVYRRYGVIHPSLRRTHQQDAS